MKYLIFLSVFISFLSSNEIKISDNLTTINYHLIWEFLGCAVLILSIFIYWNRRLQKEINENKKLQKMLKEERIYIQTLNEKLKKAKDSAENISKQKSKFLSNISHEIKSPMNSVIGYAEILDKQIIDPVQKEYLNLIKKGGNNLLKIINNILDLSKIETGKLKIKKENLNIRNLFLEIESIFHSNIISKNIIFFVDIDKELPINLISDAQRIKQILFNLIDNAVKFTEKGYIKLEVKSIYKNTLKNKIDLIITLEDTGIGIDNKNIQNIFKIFEQQNNHDSLKYGGTGLGLTICSKLIKLMKGKIKVESEKNKGSLFTVILEDIYLASEKEHIYSKELLTSGIKFEKAKILVVDDAEENRKLVQIRLKDFDFDLIMAKNGQEAINKLKNVLVDLILMDLRMPIMDGYEAIKIIKNDNQLKNIPVIALTASVIEKNIHKTADYNFDGYLKKPLIMDDLILELSKHLKYYFGNKEKQNYIDENTDKRKLKIVIEELENGLKDQWEEAKESGDFSIMEEFAMKLNTLAEEQNIYILKDYSNELIKNINTFDIEKVNYIMSIYLELINNLKRKIG